MTDPASPGGPMLSVRGEARRVVVPDYVILAGAIAFSRESKAEAVRAAASGWTASPPASPRWARWRLTWNRSAIR